MRKAFCDAMLARAGDPRMIFMTNDIGFMALEPLQAALGERFINAGVAEQNIVSVAAALAAQGFEVWGYSIAPFCYARAFEQIRNDIAFNDLPVKLVGNGGGYGYGVMGPSHHAIEDYGVLLTLGNIAIFAPAFDEDVAAVMALSGRIDSPSYIRLGHGEVPQDFAVPAYAPWRQLTCGDGMTVVALGPLAGTYLESFRELPQPVRPNFWVLSELPLERHEVPGALLSQITSARGLCVIEEHVRQGGVASQFALYLASHGIAPKRFTSLHATAHRFDRYGSQKWMRRASGLDPESVLKAVTA